MTNTLIKKTLIIVSILTLAGCATTPTQTSIPNPTKATTKAVTKPNTTSTTDPKHYLCEEQTTLSTKFDPKSDILTLILNAPTLSLVNQSIELKYQPKLSASKSMKDEYINDKNPNSIYIWHAKESTGQFIVIVDGSNYEYRCHINNQ